MKRFNLHKQFLLLLVLISLLISGCKSRNTADDINYKNGVTYLEKHQYSSALQEFKKSINTYPSNTDSYIKAAGILRDKNQHEEAIEILQNGLAKAGELDLIYLTIGEIYLASGDYSSAESNLREAFNKNKSNARAAENLAEVLILQGKFEEAFKTLESCTAGGEDKKRIDYLEAVMAVEDFDKSLNKLKGLDGNKTEVKALYNALTKAVNTDDNKIEDFMGIAYVIITNGDYVFAIKPLDVVIKENEYYHGGQLYLGYIYLNTGEHEKAKEYLQKALELDSSDLTTLRYLAQAYVNSKQQKNAIDTYESLISLENASEEIRKDYVKALTAFGDFERARPQAETLVSINPAIENRIMLVKVLLELQDFNAAERQILLAADSSEYASATDALKSKVLTYKGWIAYKKGEKAAGVGILEEALRLFTLYPETYLYLGTVYLEREDYHNAKISLERAVDLDLEGAVSLQANAELDMIR